MESIPSFIIDGCILYQKDLENKRIRLITERNNEIDKYHKWLKRAYEHFRIHNQKNEINEEELIILCNLIKDYIYDQYYPKFKELDAKIEEVSDYLVKENTNTEET